MPIPLVFWGSLAADLVFWGRLGLAVALVFWGSFTGQKNKNKNVSEAVKDNSATFLLVKDEQVG
jgi:hypothetical protein